MKLLGITDEVCTCEACGKTNLKSTVAIELENGGGVVYYGRDCAAQALYGKKSAGNTKQIDRIAKAIEYAKAWIAKRPELKHDYAYLKKISDRIDVIGVAGHVHCVASNPRHAELRLMIGGTYQTISFDA